MGLFSIFYSIMKKTLFKTIKNTQKCESSETTSSSTTFDIFIDRFNKEDRKKYLAVCFYDHQIPFTQSYDSTRLIIDENPIRINDDIIYSAKVSWHFHSDSYNSGDIYNSISKHNQIYDIKLGIDLLKLSTDSKYQIALMRSLLEKSRIERIY